MSNSRVEAYIAGFSEETSLLLRSIRDLILVCHPDIEEGFSYNMPAYKLKGPLVYFGAFQEHIGFYPTASGIDAFKHQFGSYVYSKGAVKFRLAEPIPFALIKSIVEFRIRENLEKKKK